MQDSRNQHAKWLNASALRLRGGSAAVWVTLISGPPPFLGQRGIGCALWRLFNEKRRSNHISASQAPTSRDGFVPAAIARVCDLCLENFETEYDSNVEGWVSIGAVEHGSGNGGITTYVHKTCLPDRKRANSSPRNRRWKEWKVPGGAPP